MHAWAESQIRHPHFFQRKDAEVKRKDIVCYDIYFDPLVSHKQSQ